MYYYCEKCSCNCATKLIFDKHIKTSKHLRSIQVLPVIYDCSICKKTYTRESYYNKHILLCKTNLKTNLIASGLPEEQVSTVLETLNNNTLAPSANINDLNSVSTSTITQNSNNTQTSNNIDTQNNQTATTINNVTQNIYITPFGKEDISMIPQEKRREIISHEKRAYEYLIKEMYKHNTNHNIFISDKRNKLVKYLKDDNTLTVAQLYDALTEMIENHKKILNQFIDTFADTFMGNVPARLHDLKDDHECGERDDKYMIISKKKLYEISESAKALIKKM